MKKGNKAVIMCAALLAAAAFFPAGGFCAGKMAAVAVFVSGDAQVKLAGAEGYTALKVNDSLSAGDSIKTGAGAKVSLVTKGGAEVRINENSTFDLPAKSAVREMYDLRVGQVWSRMLSKMAKLSVRTPAAVCAIRGTEADIEQKDILTVKVYEGHVDLNNAAGKQALKAGQLSTVTGAGAPAAPREMNSGEMGKWQEEIDVKDIGEYLKKLGMSKDGDKKLKLKVEKDGTAKDVDIKLKQK
ncbi:MAG TPA: FecR family protein [Elusimicrobiales bacterium]|nr:FecR family protein [Elusimicrobiales bacterium]